MSAADEKFQFLLKEARDDPQIIGLVLTGSRGKGFGSEASDFDVLLVVRPEALDIYRARFYEHESWAGFDWWVTSLPELEPVAASWGDPLAWEILCNERYSFADVWCSSTRPVRCNNWSTRRGSFRKSSACRSSTQPWVRTPTVSIAC